jgi:DNA polymerase-4
MWAPGVGVRLLGVGVTGFGAVPQQLVLPTDGEAAPDARRRSIERAVDELRERFGEDAVRFGSRRRISHDPRERYGPDPKK